MRITKINKIDSHKELLELIIKGRIKIEGDFMVIWVNTGTMWNEPIITNGSIYDDIGGILEELLRADMLPVRIWDYEEVHDICKDNSEEEQDMYINESFTYLDLGKYIGTIDSIVSMSEYIEKVI